MAQKAQAIPKGFHTVTPSLVVDAKNVQNNNLNI